MFHLPVIHIRNGWVLRWPSTYNHHPLSRLGLRLSCCCSSFTYSLGSVLENTTLYLVIHNLSLGRYLSITFGTMEVVLVSYFISTEEVEWSKGSPTSPCLCSSWWTKDNILAYITWSLTSQAYFWWSKQGVQYMHPHSKSSVITYPNSFRLKFIYYALACKYHFLFFSVNWISPIVDMNKSGCRWNWL